MEGNDRGQKLAGRIVFEAEGVGIVALVLAVVAAIQMKDVGGDRWTAVALFVIASALAFGLAANAVLRK